MADTFDYSPPGATDTAAILRALAPTQTPYGASRWKTLLECEQKHDLHYVARIRPVGGSTTIEQETGILTHACLNYVAEGLVLGGARTRSWGDVLQVASLVLDEEQRATWDPFAVQETNRLLEGYDAHWGKANLGFPSQALIVSAEVAMQQELRPGLPYSCRHDLVVEVLGETVVVDHKTRSRARSSAGDLERELRCDPSIVGQSWLAMVTLSLSSPPPVWLNDLTKTKIPAYERYLVRVEQPDVDRWKAAMGQRLQLEKERVDCGLPPLRNHYACAPYFGKCCPYLRWCHGSEEEHATFYETVPEEPAEEGTEP